MPKPLSGYLAYHLTERSRNAVLNRFQPKYPEVICDHITVQFPATSLDPLPPPARAKIVGYKDGDGIEALVVELDGTTKRADGKVYHITLSLDRSKEMKPVHSNVILAAGDYLTVENIGIDVESEFVEAGKGNSSLARSVNRMPSR